MKKYLYSAIFIYWFVSVTNSKQPDCSIIAIDGNRNKLACFGNQTIPLNISLPNVTQLYILRSQMTNVTSNFFEKLNHIELLSLSHGNLLFVNDTSFNTLYDLEELNLSFNKIKNISEKAFEKNSKLKTIHLMWNKLEELKPNTFSTLIDLESIDLTKNHLRTLDKDLFVDTKNLTELDVKFNNLTEISGVMFHSLPMLTILDLSYNKIHSIPSHAFKYNYGLKRLNLQGNRIKKLDFGLTHLGLDFINLLGNPLNTTDSKTQEVLKELKQSEVKVKVKEHKSRSRDVEDQDSDDEGIVFKFSAGVQVILGVILVLLVAILVVLSLLLYHVYKRQNQRLFKRYYPNMSRSKEYLNADSENYLQLSVSDGSVTFHNKDENDRIEEGAESSSCSNCVNVKNSINT